MISKLNPNRADNASTNAEPLLSRIHEKNHVLVIIDGDATRETVRSALQSHGYPVIAEKCPTRALCELTSNPWIKRVIICGQLACPISNELIERARRLRKRVISLMSGDCVSPTTILSLVA